VNTYPRISFRLSPDLDKRLRAKAEREGISLSQLIKKIIEHNARSLS
jgi:predicted HicB family RNase H-like nuclease